MKFGWVVTPPCVIQAMAFGLNAMRWTAIAWESSQGFRRLKHPQAIPALRAALGSRQSKNPRASLLAKLSTAEQKCIGLPEQKCISDARKKSPRSGGLFVGR